MTVSALKKLSLLMGLVLANNVSYANPQDAEIINGQVSMTSSANILSVTNTPGAIINWQSFSINANEVTQFIQQDSTSSVLNRVVGQDPSQILGQLTSNGKVFLINPNGIVFGPDAVVDTAGFIASSLNISDQDFLDSKLQFAGGSESGAIINKGYITAGENGDIFLIAPNIENSGILETDGGQLLLAAGQKLTITSLDVENVVFEVQSPTDQVTNLGELISHGGAATIFAGTIQHSGVINANTISTDHAGNIILSALDDISIADNSTIESNGLTGGNITIQSQQGDTIVQGNIEANGETGSGGQIHILGQRVGLFSNASIKANGEIGGGEVLIGGDFQGKNELIQNAEQTVVSENVVIEANALNSGDGGKVIVWSDNYTGFNGSINAHGGQQSGNGGFVEVSGKESLSYHGNIDVAALYGESGSVLFDPKNINIVIIGPDALATNDTFAENSTATSDIDPNSVTALLNAGTAVTLQASNDITISNAINVSGSNAALELQAGRSITVNASISTNGGSFTAIANSALADGVIDAQREAGAAEFRLVDVDGGNSINTAGGAIYIKVSDGSGLTNNTAGDLVLESGATLNSGGGTIDLFSVNSLILEQISAVGATITSVGGTGGNIVLTTDDLDIQTGSLITAPGTFSGNLTIVPFSTNRDIYLGTGSTGKLEISAAEMGRITAVDTLTIGRSSDTGTLTVANDLSSTDINASSLILKHQSIVTNNAIDLSTGGESLTFIAASSADFNNAIDAGTVTIEAPNASFAPNTTINIDSFTANGTDAPTSATFDGTGTTLFRSSTTLNTVTQTTGTLDTSASQTVTIDGNYNWSGGTIAGSVTANSTTTVTGDVTLNGLFNNNGTFNWSSGNIAGTLATGTGFNNNSSATLNILGNGSFAQVFTNAGTVTKSTGTGTTTFNGGLTSNSGNVTVSSGILELDGYTQTAGVTFLNGGNITDISGDGFNFDGGTLKGTGTLTTNSLNINNGASFAPGSSPGTFNVVGDLNLAAGSTLLIELGGTTQGTNYDFVDVSGAVSLNGTLNVSLFGSFTGVAGNLFDIISSGTNVMTGAFSNTILPTGYTINQGIVGAGAFYQLGFVTVPVTIPSIASVEPINTEVLILDENLNNLEIDTTIFTNNGDDELEEQALICS